MIGEAGPDGRIATLVGYGPRPGAAPQAARPPVGGRPPAPASARDVGHADCRMRAGDVPLAKPPVRKLARDLGVDLHSVAGTAPAG